MIKMMLGTKLIYQEIIIKVRRNIFGQIVVDDKDSDNDVATRSSDNLAMKVFSCDSEVRVSSHNFISFHLNFVFSILLLTFFFISI